MDLEYFINEKLLHKLKRGTCWCELGIGNPMMSGHTMLCREIQQELKSEFNYLG